MELFVGYGGVERRDAVHNSRPYTCMARAWPPSLVMAAGMEGCLKLLEDATYRPLVIKGLSILMREGSTDHRPEYGPFFAGYASSASKEGTKLQLRIPGPTPLPDEVMEAMNRNMISHRGAEFHVLMRDVTERLKFCFQTENDILIFPGAGTGGLEASIANLFSPGDTVLAVTVGAFGDRYAEIAERFGLHVVRVASEWGQAVDLRRHGEHTGANATRERRADDAQRDFHGCAKRRGKESRNPPKMGPKRAITACGRHLVPGCCGYRRG